MGEDTERRTAAVRAPLSGFAGEDVFYGHVLGFKGLERTAVVLP